MFATQEVLTETIEATIAEKVDPKVAANTVVTALGWDTVMVTILGSLEVIGSTNYFRITESEDQVTERVERHAANALDFSDYFAA